MLFTVDQTNTTFIAASEPRPVLDYATKRPKADEDGQPLYQVQVVAIGPDRADVINVKVAGEPLGVVRQAPLKITGLRATYYELPDERDSRKTRSGMAYRAERIEPLVVASRSSAPSNASS